PGTSRRRGPCGSCPWGKRADQSRNIAFLVLEPVPHPSLLSPRAARTQVTLMGKKRKQTTVTDWAEIPDTMEPQITNMTMETMGEDWVAGPPEEYDCDLALYKAPNEVLVFAYTAYGKDIIDQLCSGHEWIELNAPDDFE